MRHLWSLSRSAVRGTLVFLAAIALLTAGVQAMWIDPDAFSSAEDLGWETENQRRIAWSGDPFEAALTWRSVVNVQSNVTALDAIHLIRSATGPEGGSPRWDLVWQPDPMGWGATWVLQLVQYDEAAGSVSPALLSRHRPQAGHAYEAIVSQHPRSGALSIFVRDLTDSTVVASGTFVSSHRAEPVRAGAGYSARTSTSPGGPEPVAVAGLEKSPYYLPVGIGFRVGSADERTGALVSLQRFDWPDTITVEIEGLNTTLPGDLRLAYRSAQAERELARWRQPEAPIRFSIPAIDLPSGAGVIAWEYIDDGRVLLADSRPVHIGQVNLHIGALTVDAGERALRGALRLTSAVPVEGVEIGLEAQIAQLVWDDSAREYRRRPYANATLLSGSLDLPGPEGLEAPISIPMPEEAGTWEVTFTWNGSVHLEVTEAGGRRLFITAPEAGDAERTPERFRVCTYNMLGFQGWPQDRAAKDLGDLETQRRFEHFAGVINELNCDILGIQEGRSLDWLGRLARAAGRNAARFPSPTAFPGAVFSRYPILDQRDFAGGLHAAGVPFSRTAGSALLDVNGRLLWVVNIHAHPNQPDLREVEAEILGRHVDDLMHVSPHVIVLGDFNSESGGAIHQALRRRGFASTMELAGAGPPHTVTNLRGVGTLAIDFIYVSPSLLGAVEFSRVVSDPGFRMSSFAGEDAWVHSDHLPVVAEFSW